MYAIMNTHEFGIGKLCTSTLLNRNLAVPDRFFKALWINAAGRNPPHPL